MKIVISSLGTRGEVQPIIALALELRALGHSSTLCVAPNFLPWIESLGLNGVAVGPDLQKWMNRPITGDAKKSGKEEMRKIRAGMGNIVREQFEVMLAAARGCDLIVVCGAVQSAGASVAELYNIPYVFATYCPCTLPSPHHPPPMVRRQTFPRFVNRLLWLGSSRFWKSVYLDAVNTQRAALGLASVRDMARHVSTDDPWVAADAALAPAKPFRGKQPRQTGAWLLPDTGPLPEELNTFLAAGEPPIYLGIGSMRGSDTTAKTLVDSVRAIGRRAILSRGWGNLELQDTGADCIVIGDVSHEQLFPRVAAIVHHGGAGTTTAAARSGRPQVVVPHMYDQFYFARRVEQLGIGTQGPAGARPTSAALADALRNSLVPAIAQQARAFASKVELHGARIAAEQLIAQCRNT